MENINLKSSALNMNNNTHQGLMIDLTEANAIYDLTNTKEDDEDDVEITDETNDTIDNCSMSTKDNVDKINSHNNNADNVDQNENSYKKEQDEIKKN